MRKKDRSSLSLIQQLTRIKRSQKSHRIKLHQWVLTKLLRKKNRRHSSATELPVTSIWRLLSITWVTSQTSFSKRILSNRKTVWEPILDLVIYKRGVWRESLWNLVMTCASSNSLCNSYRLWTPFLDSRKPSYGWSLMKYLQRHMTVVWLNTVKIRSELISSGKQCPKWWIATVTSTTISERTLDHLHQKVTRKRVLRRRSAPLPTHWLPIRWCATSYR